MKYAHGYHLVNSSPWPLTVSWSLGCLFISMLMGYNNKIGSLEIFIISMISIIYSVYKWFNEIIIESTYKGEHTKIVQKLINSGFIIFVISEIIVFITLFYCLFYIYYIPSVECNYELKPLGIESINYEALPLLNTALLFFGSLTITAAQYTLVSKEKTETIILYIITIFLNLLFSYLQYCEYINSSFTLTDSFYGSIFYYLTGCHALHVLVGSSLIIAALFRINHYTNTHHVLSTLSSLYNHFVDIVWIILFVILYVSL